MRIVTNADLLTVFIILFLCFNHFITEYNIASGETTVRPFFALQVSCCMQLLRQFFGFVMFT